MRTKGIPGEFAARLQEMDKELGPRRNLGDYANRLMYLTFKMAEEAGVELMLSTYVVGPILEEQYIVRGLIVENKSGRQAIRAKVTVDATGDAAVAARTLGADHSVTKALARAAQTMGKVDLWKARLAIRTLRWDEREAIAEAAEG